MVWGKVSEKFLTLSILVRGMYEYGTNKIRGCQ